MLLIQTLQEIIEQPLVCDPGILVRVLDSDPGVVPLEPAPDILRRPLLLCTETFPDPPTHPLHQTDTEILFLFFPESFSVPGRTAVDTGPVTVLLPADGCHPGVDGWMDG